MTIFCCVAGISVIPACHWVWLNGGFTSDVVQQRGVPAALQDHDYWRREPSTGQAPRGRRRRREQEHRSLGERPRRRPRLDAAVQSSGPLSSASVSFSGPQVSSVPQPSASGQGGAIT
ncbi:Progestin and adipoQ receptor family member 3 [Larimichthys crocea]|uniref:Uncharacterized protein n=1 Tax=Larimichthys crocea TaxID=215358 RepID=A0ACD3QLU2_LARCR|nr:Progestin and adipoQ receptor family member 3 [Larimichthys crocea]